MVTGFELSRRALLALGGTAALATALPGWAGASAASRQHGFSPLGSLKYPQDFAAFDYVNPEAPKGGTLRLARIGAFDTVDTLRYPGRPPADIRMIYDRLVARSDDEAASYYCVLAREVAVADDFSEIAFALHPDARWHDGRPVTAADVVFTFDTLKAEGAPFYRQAFLPLTVSDDGDGGVRFRNANTGNRDVIRQIATIPIHPAHVWRDGGAAAADGLPIGSGPYRVAEVNPGRSLVLERVADYWGGGLGINRGRWNFDRLQFEYYRDATVALEAFRADEYDLRTEDSPVRWQNGYDGSALSSGAIRRLASARSDGHTLHGLVFNLRRPLLADRRVRLALSLAYDFEAVNRVLFAGAYARFDSVFGDTDLAADGPAEGEERAFLESLDDPLAGEALIDPDPLSDLPLPGTRAALSEAARLLDEAGLTIEDGVRVDPATGQPVTFDLVSMNPVYDRPLTWVTEAFDQLGVTVRRVETDPATGGRLLLDRAFDIATLSWSPAPLPGTAERLLWHSALAEMPHSYALSGIANPALDAAIEALQSARSPQALTVAARAFDRLFRRSAVMLPLWRSSETWIAWWDRFGRPDAEQAGFPASPIDRWWAV